MSRSGYNCYDDYDYWATIRWSGAVKSAIRGKRGQAFLRDLLAALDAMPEKRLIAGDLVFDGRGDDDEIIVGGDELVTEHGEVIRVGEVCALGALGRARQIDMSSLDPHDTETVAGTFGIADALTREVVYVNDEDFYGQESPEARWQRVRDWVIMGLRVDEAKSALPDPAT